VFRATHESLPQPICHVLTKFIPTPSSGNRFTNDLRIQHIPNGSTQMADVPSVILTSHALPETTRRFHSPNGIQRVLSLMFHRMLEQGIKLNRHHRSCWINQNRAARGQQSLEPRPARIKTAFHNQPVTVPGGVAAFLFSRVMVSLKLARVPREFQSHYPHHHKTRITARCDRLRCFAHSEFAFWTRRTTRDQMAVHRKLDRLRDDLVRGRTS